MSGAESWTGSSGNSPTNHAPPLATESPQTPTSAYSSRRGSSGSARCGVYYAVEEAPVHKVIVLAVAIKDRDRIFIGGKEVEP
jgi:hypothetical protein